MIEVHNLKKHFKAVKAVDDISFVAEDGKITGLLGPNGAGKSTTLKMLYTVLEPDSGKALIDGFDSHKDSMTVQTSIGVLTHNAGIYERLTARENIRYFGELHGLSGEQLNKRINELVDVLDMEKFIDRRCKGFSQGQKTKVALARALVHKPKNVLLDEPTNGLDVMATRGLREVILRLKEAGHCVLGGFSPSIEVYLIDEGFLDMQGFNDWNLHRYGEEICSTVHQWTGIPVSIGFGPTKTLAKLANRVSKKQKERKGVFSFNDAKNPSAVLRSVAVGDVWGVTRRWSERLAQEGIHSALDLQRCNAGYIKKRFGTVLARTVQELQGVSCIELEEVRADRQQVLCSRSFGSHVTEYQDMRAAITRFVTRACEKLRHQKLLASAISVHVSTSPFDKSQPYYSNTVSQRLVVPSDDTRDLTAVAQQLLKSIYREGHSYQRGGVLLMDLVSQRNQQHDLFSNTSSKHSDALMTALDSINSKMGSGVIRFAGEGVDDKAGWRMNQNLCSPRYTTRFSDLRVVR